MEIKIPSKYSRLLLLLSISILSLVFLTPSVSAVGEKPTKTQEQGKRLGKLGLAPGQLRACQAKEKSIKNRLTRLTDLVTNMESKFTSIEARVEDYYISKVVPSGKTVPNYDNLVSDIEIKKTAVQTILTTIQDDVTGFSCTGSDPKGQLTQFRENMKNIKGALKKYRTSIKNLIVAVRSVTGNMNRQNAGTVKPTKAGQGL